MSIYHSELWDLDLVRVLRYYPEISNLEGKSILITGAAGLVCSAIVDLLIKYNETHAKKIKIFAAGRWREEMEERFSDYISKDYFSFVKYDASKNDNDIAVHVDYVIHGASNASPNMIIREPVETLVGNVLGLKYLFDISKESAVSRVLYISSSEVYGKRVGNNPICENEFGYIDILNPRNSYSIGKIAAESLCISYAEEYGIESVIVRPGHIYGPTANQYDTRIGSAWAYDAATGRNITMKSDGRQIRSYVYCLDCAAAILLVLIKGRSGEAYNISNKDSILSIRELGVKMSCAGSVSFFMEEPTKEEMKGFNPMQNSSLQADKLESLGWKGLFDADTGITHTVSILRGIINDNKNGLN